MKKRIMIILVAGVMLLSLCCSGCGDKAKNITRVSIGDSFEVISVEGTRSCVIENVRMTDNVTEFGIDASELGTDDVYLGDSGKETYMVWSDCMDPASGQLAEHLRFVLVDVTMTNVDAISIPLPEDDDGVRDDSWYAFCVDNLTICDIGEQGRHSFLKYHNRWYAGTGEYDAAEMGTNGSNYYVLRPGETLSFQMGFVVGNSKDDFSELYITDGGGSYYSEGATYVYLDLSDDGEGM